MLEPVDAELVRTYELYPVLAQHYSLEAAFRQKIGALSPTRSRLFASLPEMEPLTCLAGARAAIQSATPVLDRETGPSEFLDDAERR